MAAQAISALVQVGETPVPAQFGISSAQASQLGLTISAGLTPAFWIYCGFLVALIVSCAWMLFTPHSVPVAPGEGYGPRPDDSADDGADDSIDDSRWRLRRRPTARPRPRPGHATGTAQPADRIPRGCAASAGKRYKADAGVLMFLSN